MHYNPLFKFYLIFNWRLRNDLDANTKAVPLTMTNNEEGSLMIVTLLLTGRATPYLHNGVVNVGDESTYVSIFEKSAKIIY